MTLEEIKNYARQRGIPERSIENDFLGIETDEKGNVLNQDSVMQNIDMAAASYLRMLENSCAKSKISPSTGMIYSKHMDDMLSYLTSKLPTVPAHTVHEIAAYLSNRTLLLVNDILIEYAREHKKSYGTIRRSRFEAESERT